MKKILFMMVLSLSVLTFGSCGESAKEKAQRDLIDSLENANAQGRMDYADLQQYLSIIADGLDSISIEEHELLVNNTPGENMGFNRQRMQQNLNHVREILSRHRSRIAELEAKLASQTGDAKNLRVILASLRQQLDAKDRELAQLKADLEDNKKSVAMLRTQVQQISEENETQAQTIQDQQRVIDSQAEQMNKGFIKIASKKELKELGLLTGGFLKKKKVDYSNIDLSKFQVVDIRNFKSINLPSKSKIISAVPEGSYSIESSSNGEVLRIINSERFWSVSNFLIIQTN